MVLHGGGPGLIVPRKRVVPGDVMWATEDNGNASWDSVKATEASRGDYQTTPETSTAALDESLDPPLRTEDDFDCDSDDGRYGVSDGCEQSHGEPLLGYSSEVSTAVFNLGSSRELTREVEDMGGVEEEVADSELAATQLASSAVEEEEVDMGFDEFNDLLKEPPVPPEDLRLAPPQLGTDLGLGSSSGFSLEVSQSNAQPMQVKERAFLSEQQGLQLLAQQMDEEDDEALFASTQESSLSHPGLLSPRLTTHNFMLPPLDRAQQSGTLSDHQASSFNLDFDHIEHSRHSAPPVLQQGNETSGSPAGSSLHLSILDNSVDVQSSHDMVFRSTSRDLEHGLLFNPFPRNIDHERPSQSSGSVLASEGNFTGSNHTDNSARMARPPPGAIVAVHKQVGSSRDINRIHILSSDSESDHDSGIDNDNDSDFMFLTEMEFPFQSGQTGARLKRRAEEALTVYAKKRPNIVGGSSEQAALDIYESMMKARANGSILPATGKGKEWQQVPQHSFEDTISKSWGALMNSQMAQQWNSKLSAPIPLPNSYGPTGYKLDHGLKWGGGTTVQYSKSSVQTIANRSNSVTYDLNVKNPQVARAIVPATAESLMKDTLSGNNKEEESPPEGQLAVPLLRHQRVALAWMKKRESGFIPGYDGILQGGILADDQGLGKTISTISLILKERAPIKKISPETLCVDVLDDGDDSLLTGKSSAVVPSTFEKPANPVKVSNPGKESSVQNTRTDVMAVSGKFRPAAGTLVVCPTSVLRQWESEIKEKVTEKANLSVLIYHGSNRTRNPDDLIKYDVVLTTYSIVSMEVPKQPLPEEKGNDNKDGPPPFRAAGKTKKPKKAAENGKKGRGNAKGRLVESENGSVDSGPLARVTWFRVVLDEAQSIKNARTQGARAAWGLRSKRRWCLSGTPIQNAIDDLYSYFRFLRYSPYDSYKKFREMVKEPVARHPAHGYANLLKLLTPVMLRRTKATKIDGQPIVKLPERIVNLRQAEFSDEERAFYNNLENESRKQFEDYAAAGTLQSNYVNILWMLLRLRQACDHPLLVKGHHHQRTQKVILDSANKLPAEKRKHLLALLEGNRDICPICSDLPDEAVVCVCTHVFCRQCISEQLATGDDTCCPVPKCRKSLNTSLIFTLASLKRSESGEGSSSRESSSLLEGTVQEGQSPVFGGWKSSSKIDAVIDTLNALPVVSEVEVKDEPTVQTNKDFKDAITENAPMLRIGHQEPLTKANHVGDSPMEGETPLLLAKRETASASSENILIIPCHESAVKAEKVELGLEDMDRKTGIVTRDSSAESKTREQDVIVNRSTTRKIVLTEKAIVFSQWTSMLDLLESKLKESKFNYRRLDGTMSVLARDRAVSEFKTLPEVNVIIMSLKAASLGLNMVAACHVLLLDVWWNPTTEDQAIDRAHRIGQTRPVNVSRFTVKNTIEDRILALQEKKRHMVASAFGESQGGGNGHLSAAELDYLFNGENRGYPR